MRHAGEQRMSRSSLDARLSGTVGGGRRQHDSNSRHAHLPHPRRPTQARARQRNTASTLTWRCKLVSGHRSAAALHSDPSSLPANATQCIDHQQPSYSQPVVSSKSAASDTHTAAWEEASQQLRSLTRAHCDTTHAPRHTRRCPQQSTPPYTVQVDSLAGREASHNRWQQRG